MPSTRGDLSLFVGIFNGSSRGRFTSLEMVSPLKAIILPMRSKRIARNYQSIWTEQGSPLLAITKQQQAGLQAYLNEKGINAQVEIAMTYGNPSMQSAVKNLLKNSVERMIVLPLYPQYSSTTNRRI